MKDGGPAFPSAEPRLYVYNPDGSNAPEMVGDKGMTLRDWLAGQALTGSIAATSMAKAGSCKPEQFGPIMAKMSYEIADAMLVEREKE